MNIKQFCHPNSTASSKYYSGLILAPQRMSKIKKHMLNHAASLDMIIAMLNMVPFQFHFSSSTKLVKFYFINEVLSVNEKNEGQEIHWT